MNRRSDESDIADKLLRIVESLRRGDDIRSAATASGIDPNIVIPFLESLKKESSPDPVSKTPPGSGGNPDVPSMIAYSDGASRGNPGEGACAVILTDEGGEEYLRRAKRLGVVTNNVAEYEGVILALELAQTLRVSELRLRLDSELVVNQLNGRYKVKHPSLKPLYERARLLITSFHRVDVAHVPRTETTAVDKLANDELDGTSGSGSV